MLVSTTASDVSKADLTFEARLTIRAESQGGKEEK